MHKFQIQINRDAPYPGLFATSVDAVLDALARNPGATRVFVKAVK